jgi:hypothetical protein
MIAADTAPWYRQRWPWLLMLGPALVLVAGSYTTWLAYKSDDGLVARDYYKRGLLINQTLQRDHNAAALGLAAQGVWNADGTALSVQVSGRIDPAATLTLRVLADNKSGMEMAVPLTPVGDGWYVAAVARPASPNWHGVIESTEWRLTLANAVPGKSPQFEAADP